MTGVVRMALSGLDMALWDALAMAAGLPLATLLGGTPRPVPAYNCSGLGLMEPEAAADEAVKLLEGGFKAVKLRLGYPTPAKATSRRCARCGGGCPTMVALMVDYNQALTVAEALRRGRALDGEGVYWLEEPIRHDDYAGNAAIARELAAAGADRRELRRSAGHGGRARGGRLRLRHARPRPHRRRHRLDAGGRRWPPRTASRCRRTCFPEVSAHLLAATPTAHWLEYVDWAGAAPRRSRCASRTGTRVVPDRPGSGLAWDDKAIEHYRID